jgi:hypothetical protein
MLNIARFLEKFKKISLDKESQKQIVIDVLKTFNIPVVDVTIKNKVAKVNASSLVKNQIYMKKSAILQKLPNIVDII